MAKQLLVVVVVVVEGDGRTWWGGGKEEQLGMEREQKDGTQLERWKSERGHRRAPGTLENAAGRMGKRPAGAGKSNRREGVEKQAESWKGSSWEGGKAKREGAEALPEEGKAGGDGGEGGSGRMGAEESGCSAAGHSPALACSR